MIRRPRIGGTLAPALGAACLAVLLALLLSALVSAGCALGTAERQVLRLPSEPMVEHRAGMIDEPVFGGRMYLFVAGPLEPETDIETVLLVHGLTADGAGDWRLVVPELAKRHRVVAFDLPGFARSDQGDHLYSPERYSELLHWLIAEWAQGRVTLVGHSLGGTLSLYHAGEHPDDVDRLVVVDAAGILHRTAYIKYVAELRNAGLLSASPDLEEGLNQIIGRLVEATEGLPGTDMGKVLADRRLRHRYFRSEPAAVAGTAMIEVNFSQRLPAVVQPTLVLWGQDDEVAPLRTAHVLAARLPDVSVQVIAGAGHAPMLSRPAEFNRRLLAALDDWPAADPRRLPARTASSRVGTCEGRDDVTFVGNYAELRIKGCDRVKVRDGSLGSVTIEGGSAEFLNVRIDADAVGLTVDDSQVTLTNVRIEADTALLLDDARVDLAAVELVGHSHAVRSLDLSNLVCSVCRVDSPHGSGTLHGLYEIGVASQL